MLITDLVFALIVAFVFMLLVAAAGRGRGPWGSVWLLFLVLFLAIWAGGIWLAPFGPLVFGVAWLPFLVIGLLVALLLAAAVPAAPPAPPEQPANEVEKQKAETAGTLFTGFLWIFVALLILALIIHYIDWA